MSLNDIDDTLVAYFKQMLDEEAFDAETQEEQPSAEPVMAEASFQNDQVQEPSDKASVDPVQEIALEDENSQRAVSEEDIDYASDDYMPEEQREGYCEEDYSSADISLEPMEDDDRDNTPEVQMVSKVEESTPESLPYAEHKSIASLLEKVEVVNLAQTETDVETETEVETQTETALETESVQTEQKQAVAENAEDTQNENPYEWENIDMPNEFQVLFFLVKGIRFAVPLVNLGGIFQSAKVTPLFGKPKWFMGIADVRGNKMNVVDTLKWVKSDAPKADNYEYMIVLDKTLWSIGCDELEGNRILSKDNITWRQQAGNRPWLAGIVKKEMCALLHVDALIKMFENGVNLKDLDTQMSA